MWQSSEINMCNNEHKSKKSYLKVCTKLSRMFLLHLKEIRGLLVQMADVSSVTARLPITYFPTNYRGSNGTE